MNYKKILVAYIQSKLSELSDVDDYDAETKEILRKI